MKNIYNYLTSLLVYISIFFVVYYLYNTGVYKNDFIVNSSNFVISLIFLLLGIFLQVVIWYFLIQRHSNGKLFLLAFQSEMTSILNKYIPGKVAAIVGPTLRVKSVINVNYSELIFDSITAQVIIIITGLFFGSAVLIFQRQDWIFVGFVIAPILVLVLLIILKNYLHKKKIIYNNIFLKIPNINFTIIKKILFISLFQWISWVFAFFFFASDYIDSESAFKIALNFPLSCVVSFFVIFTPGGIGAREAFMVYIANGINIGNIDELTNIIINSRLWFFVGEFLAFIMGLISLLIPKKSVLI